MQALKDAKRRVVERAAESLGKSERVKQDEEQMKTAIEGFKLFETEVKSLQESLKTAQAATAKWTEKNHVLAQTMYNFFQTENGSLKQASLHMSSAALQAHEIVQRSAAHIIQEKGIALLESLLNERFPALKKKIVEHNNLETDVSAYNRRVKGMLEKKSGTDPDVVKTQEKLQRATTVYEQLHRDLLNELETLVRDKHNIIRPVFVATLAASSELQAVLSDEFTESVKSIGGSEVDQVRQEINNLVKSGGPPNDTQRSNNPLSMRAMFRGAGSMTTPKPSANGGGNDTTAPFHRSAGSATTKSNMSPPTKTNSMASMSAPTTKSYHEPEYPTTVPPIPSKPAEFNSPPPPPPVAQGEELPFEAGAVCVAIFDYDGPDPGDLSFKVDERVRMEVEVSAGWWNGTRELDGSYGLFPETYVRRIE